MIRIALTLLPALLALAACQDSAKPVAQASGAAGEVLGGSISDAMIPYETLTSQAPFKKVAPASRTPADDSAPRAAANGTPAEETGEPAPAAEPTAETETPATAPAEPEA